MRLMLRTVGGIKVHTSLDYAGFVVSKAWTISHISSTAGMVPHGGPKYVTPSESMTSKVFFFSRECCSDFPDILRSPIR